jgi:hypothetical protein
MNDICDPCINHCFVLADKLNLCPLIKKAKTDMILFTCSHKKTSFPMKLRTERIAHITCLDCGREFDYDWNEMKVIKNVGRDRNSNKIKISITETPESNNT